MQHHNDNPSNRSEKSSRPFAGECVFWLVLLVAVFATPGLMHGCGVASESTVAAEDTAGKVIHFKIEGLHCDGCAVTARNAIAKIDGVQRCTVSFDDASAEVVVDAENEEAIVLRVIEAVEDKGFTAEPSGS